MVEFGRALGSKAHKRGVRITGSLFIWLLRCPRVVEEGSEGEEVSLVYTPRYEEIWSWCKV